MAKQTINIGTSVNKGDGDPLRTAFSKINDNFSELYTGTVLDLSAVNQHIIPAVTDTYDLGTLEKQWRSLYLTGSTVYFNGIPLSVTDDGTIIVNGQVAATPGGDLTWDSITGKPTFATVATSGSYRDLTDKPTFGASNGLTATTDVDGNVNVGFSGILYVGSQTQYGFEEIVDESGPSPIYSSRLSLPLTTEFLGGDISLTAWGPGVNITVRNTDTLDEYGWSFGNDGSMTFPDDLTVSNGVIGKSSSTTISEETPGGTISETTEIESQIEIATTGIVIAKRTRITSDDTVTTSTDEAGSTLTVNNSTASIKHYVEPDGPNNGSYFQVSTSGVGAVLEGVNETLNGTDYGRVVATQNAVTVNTSVEGVDKYWLFDYLGGLTLPTPTSQVFTLTFDATHYSPTVGKPSLELTSEPWQLEGQIQYEQNGNAILQLNNIWPTLVNPGYSSGDAFTFSSLVHGLSDYTLTITLNDVVLAGGAGWTASVGASQLPAYPSNISANGAIKLTAGNESFIFGADGNLHFPDGSFQGSAFVGIADTARSLSKDEDITVTITDGLETTQQWTFGTNGTLTLPQYHWIESVGSNATITLNGVGSNESSIYLSTNLDGEQIGSSFEIHPNGVGLNTVRSIDIHAGYDEATFKRDAWQGAEAVWVEVRDQDAQLIAPGTRTWAGMPSYEAYPLLMDFIQNIPGGEIPPSSNMAPAALTAKTAYELWQAEQAAINVTITAKDKTWTFGNNGSITLPAGGDILNSNSESVLGLTVITPEEYQVPGVRTLAFAGAGVSVDRIDDVTTVTILGSSGDSLDQLEVDERTILTDPDETISIQTSYYPRISAEAFTGSSTGIFVADISEVDDIIEVQAGWQFNAGTEVAPIWETVVSAVTDDSIHTLEITGIEFIPGFVYEFRNPNAVDYQWEFTDSGTLNAPGGAILSSETETINNTFITYDLSSASRINKVYWESGGDQPTLRYLHLGVATDSDLPLEVVAYQLEDELNGYGATGGRIIRFTATSGTTYNVTIPQYSNIQWSTSIPELGGEPGISWLIQEGVWGDNGAPTADTIINITSLLYSSLDTYYRNFAIEIPSPDGEDEYRWEFSNSGTLIVPGTITKETRLTLNSSGPESGYTAAVLADGNLGKVLLRTDNGTITKTWEFDVSGNLTLPANGTISYSPGNTDNWNEPAVNTVQAALDELAARVTALQNYEIDGGNAYTPPQGETIIDGNGA